MRVGALQNTSAVHWETRDGSAKAGKKYIAASGGLEFEPSGLYAQIRILTRLRIFVKFVLHIVLYAWIENQQQTKTQLNEARIITTAWKHHKINTKNQTHKSIYYMSLCGCVVFFISSFC